MARPGFAAVGIVLTICCATAAHAQTGVRRPLARRAGEPRFLLSVSGGVESPGAHISDRVTFERNVETETIDVTYPTTPGVLVDVGVSARVWKRMGVGFAVGHVTGTGTADVSAGVPHPFLFNQPRSVTGRESGMSRGETGVHLQVQYAVPASGRIHVVLGAGPSRIKLTQDVVTDVDVAESYPFDTADFVRAVTKGASASVNGFNAGADVTWRLNRSVGFGGLLRYTRADADLDVRSGHSLSLKAGGFQAAGGVRLAF